MITSSFTSRLRATSCATIVSQAGSAPRTAFRTSCVERQYILSEGSPNMPDWTPSMQAQIAPANTDTYHVCSTHLKGVQVARKVDNDIDNLIDRNRFCWLLATYICVDGSTHVSLLCYVPNVMQLQYAIIMCGEQATCAYECQSLYTDSQDITLIERSPCG